jgi:exodeoxyribonuclease VII small subunit
MSESKAKPKRSRSTGKASAPDAAGQQWGEWLKEIEGLSYQEASTALELALSQLQSTDLEVEQMAGLYRRAQAYADRCEGLLDLVEQEVVEWEAKNS